MNTLTRTLTGTAAAAALIAGLSAAPASAAGFSFVPTSGTISYLTSSDTLALDLFNAGSTEELKISGDSNNGLTNFGGGTYSGVIDTGSFALKGLPAKNLLDQGLLTNPFSFTISGSTLELLSKSVFTDTSGQSVGFGNGLMLTSTDSPINNIQKGNIGSASGTFAPVPESGTVVSFGALLGLGGLALLGRKRTKTAA